MKHVLNSVIIIVLMCSIGFSQQGQYQGLVSQVFYSRFADRDFNLAFQGIGARTLGMGRAGISAANDLSAIYWNPANTTNLSAPIVTIHGRMDLDQREFTTPDKSGLNVISTINPALTVHFIAAAYPINIGNRRLVISGAFQNLNNMTRKIKDMHYLYGGGRLKEESKINGGISALSPSLAIDLLPQISIGATYNYLTSNSDFRLGLESPYADHTVYFEFKDEEQYSGAFINIGVAIKPAKWLSLGFSATPSWKYTIKEKKESTRLLAILTGTSGIGYLTHKTPDDSLYEFSVNLPLKYGVGLALKPLQNITLAADYRVNPWSKTEILAEGKKIEQEMVDTDIISLGAEWVLSTGVWSMPFRLGYYTNPTPYKDKWFQDHYEGEQITGDAWTFGVGYIYGHITFDLAFEHGWHQMGWWMDAGDYYNDRMILTKDIFNRLTMSLTYQF